LRSIGTSFGIVTPGFSSVSAHGVTVPCGVASSSGVSCMRGAATTSVWVPRWVTDISDTSAASVWKIWKSVRASHGGSIAALKVCT